MKMEIWYEGMSSVARVVPIAEGCKAKNSALFVTWAGHNSGLRIGL